MLFESGHGVWEIHAVVPAWWVVVQSLPLVAFKAVLRSDALQLKSENDAYWYMQTHCIKSSAYVLWEQVAL